MATATKSWRLRFDHFFHRRLANPIASRVPGQILLETLGRKSGQLRQTPVGGKIDGKHFWMVSDHGDQSDYVRNIKANPSVRVRVGGIWHNGVAHPMPEDDALARLKTLPRMNSAVVRALGTNLLTVRIDLTN
ncbi:nitroreductase/quinone reductase family protein [Nocardia sp. XZ_19_385]|uniref:nitroreductase/quinone reductase family protein n=1 Tax=Nocardia sp. XZ_19_385 TaxID=2769488 RepID=UPI00188E64F2|nr:nitroreductase/quinone reductase family protein [Nocardia sp. XZ_19_385]